jgi:hypothetical protein
MLSGYQAWLIRTIGISSGQFENEYFRGKSQGLIES